MTPLEIKCEPIHTSVSLRQGSAISMLNQFQNSKALLLGEVGAFKLRRAVEATVYACAFCSFVSAFVDRSKEQSPQ